MFFVKFTKALAAAFLVSLLAGCASTYNDGTRAGQAGNYALAEQLFIKAIQEGDNVPSSWNNLGVVYMNTNRTELAVRSYTMGARYGNAVSQGNLVSLNRPVPPPDLVNVRQVGMRAEAVSRILYAAQDVCNCKGSAAPGGPCYAGPGGPAYDGSGGPAYRGPGGACYVGPGGPQYSGPGGPAYPGPGGPRYDGPGGPAYSGPGGPAYAGPGGACYSGPGGPCYSGPGGTGRSCPAVCK